MTKWLYVGIFYHSQFGHTFQEVGASKEGFEVFFLFLFGVGDLQQAIETKYWEKIF